MSYIDSLRPSSADTALQKARAALRQEAAHPTCTAIASVATAAGLSKDAVSAVCTFSSDSLERVGNALSSGYGSVEDAVSDSAEWVADTVGSVTSEAVSLYQDIAGLAQDGVDAVDSAIDTVNDSVNAVTSEVAGYGALALAAGVSLLGIGG